MALQRAAGLLWSAKHPATVRCGTLSQLVPSEGVGYGEGSVMEPLEPESVRPFEQGGSG